MGSGSANCRGRVRRIVVGLPLSRSLIFTEPYHCDPTHEHPTHRRRSPRHRQPDREGDHHAGSVPAVAQRADERLQPEEQSRSGAGARRAHGAGDARRAREEAPGAGDARASAAACRSTSIASAIPASARWSSRRRRPRSCASCCCADRRRRASCAAAPAAWRRCARSSEVESGAQPTLATREDGPFVVRLAREPGRRESRYAHLFSGCRSKAPAEPVIRAMRAQGAEAHHATRASNDVTARELRRAGRDAGTTASPQLRAANRARQSWPQRGLSTDAASANVD